MWVLSERNRSSASVSFAGTRTITPCQFRHRKIAALRPGVTSDDRQEGGIRGRSSHAAPSGSACTRRGRSEAAETAHMLRQVSQFCAVDRGRPQHALPFSDIACRRCIARNLARRDAIRRVTRSCRQIREAPGGCHTGASKAFADAFGRMTCLGIHLFECHVMHMRNAGGMRLPSTQFLARLPRPGVRQPASREATRATAYREHVRAATHRDRPSRPPRRQSPVAAAGRDRPGSAAPSVRRQSAAIPYTR